MKEFTEMVEKIINLIKETLGVDKAPWWARMIILPVMLVVGAIYVFDDELGQKAIEWFFKSLERWRKTFMKVGKEINAPEAVEAVFNRFGDLFGQAKNAVLNYFGDPNRRSRWRWRIRIIAGLMVLLLMGGLIFHYTAIGKISIAAAGLLFSLPLFAIGGILASIKTTSKWGLWLTRPLAIIWLVVIGALVTGNKNVYLMVLALTAFFLLVGYAFSGKSRGLLPTIRVLALFVGLCFAGRVITTLQNIHQPTKNFVEGVGNWLDGRSDKFRAALNLKRSEDKDAAKFSSVLAAAEEERPRRQIAEPAALWAILEESNQPQTRIKNLETGQVVTAFLNRQQKDDLEEWYTFIILWPDTGESRVAGWVQSRVLMDIANEQVLAEFAPPPKPEPTAVQKASLVPQATSVLASIDSRYYSSANGWEATGAGNMAGQPGYNGYLATTNEIWCHGKKGVIAYDFFIPQIPTSSVQMSFAASSELKPKAPDPNDPQYSSDVQVKLNDQWSTTIRLPPDDGLGQEIRLEIPPEKFHTGQNQLQFEVGQGQLSNGLTIYTRQPIRLTV